MKNMQTRTIEFSAPGVVAVGEEEIATDNLGEWEVIVQNEVSLVSAGTELARLHGLEPDLTFPFRPGYACIGHVVDKGAAVDDFEIGQRVFYAGKHASAQRFRHGQNHQWGRLYTVPDALPSEAAIFGALAGIAMTAPCVTALDLNDTVAVFGLGLVGNLAAQLYHLMGARVIALDPIAKRCELARAAGLQNVVSVAPEEQVAAVVEQSGGKGAHVTVDAVGHSAVIANCIAATALFGQVILLGTPRAPQQDEMTPLWHAIHTNGLTVRGAHMWRFPAAALREAKKTVPWGYATMFDLIVSGKLQIAPLRSHLARPEDAPQMYDGLHRDRENYWGVVFDWREGRSDSQANEEAT